MNEIYDLLRKLARRAELVGIYKYLKRAAKHNTNASVPYIGILYFEASHGAGAKTCDCKRDRFWVQFGDTKYLSSL